METHEEPLLIATDHLGKELITASPKHLGKEADSRQKSVEDPPEEPHLIAAGHLGKESMAASNQPSR